MSPWTAPVDGPARGAAPYVFSVLTRPRPGKGPGINAAGLVRSHDTGWSTGFSWGAVAKTD